ncbi:MAG: hypothetical protein J6T98_00065 [Salinivirgaceae bacterium]|nr:hypothetical protein [Salinivirgaceae bacterium]
MEINNANKASQVRMAYGFVPILVVLSVAVIYWGNFSTNLVWLIGGIAILAIYVAVAVLFGNNFVIIYVGPDKVIVRYKALWPVRTENNSIEIDASDFAGYEITKTRFRTNLTVFKNTPGGVAKYPNVCINLLDGEQIEKIKRAFAILETITKKSN